jgi:hypothetical protein
VVLCQEALQHVNIAVGVFWSPSPIMPRHSTCLQGLGKAIVEDVATGNTSDGPSLLFTPGLGSQ